jgi:hypothetical protein
MILIYSNTFCQGNLKNKKPALAEARAGLNIPGDVLLSHACKGIVSSALEGLTSVFGMGTGVTPPVRPPRIR